MATYDTNDFHGNIEINNEIVGPTFDSKQDANTPSYMVLNILILLDGEVFFKFCLRQLCND